MTANNQAAETTGAAIVAFTLSRTLFSILVQKRVISPAETDLLLEGMLVAIESILDPNDPATRPARELLETVAQEVRQSLEPR